MARTEAAINPPPNSTGQPVRLIKIILLDGSNATVEQQVILEGDPDDANNIAGVTRSGERKVIDQEVHNLLFAVLTKLDELIEAVKLK